MELAIKSGYPAVCCKKNRSTNVPYQHYLAITFIVVGPYAAIAHKFYFSMTELIAIRCLLQTVHSVQPSLDDARGNFKRM